MKCIIVDDEPLAIDIIETYLDQINGMEIIAKCNNPLDAVTLINKHQVDLVFLDIEMPNLNGIDLVKTINTIPQFIFTTAYPQYALEGFELNATDYLVKPIPFHRFLKAISKAKEKYQLEQSFSAHSIATSPPQKSLTDDFIFVKAEYENVKILVENIQYIQGLKDYLKIRLKDTNKSIITLSNFKDVLVKLPGHFLRVHRSYIVNINHITTLQKTKIVIDGIRIPIGETYKNDVLKRLGV
ncbi:MAG: response regulator transcription factor [Flavobacteriaceae bacterium]|nr:response regulator transcription factor [Flavobacteriaceae bacterium]